MKLTIALIALITFCCIMSCSKSDNNVKTTSFAGLWIGKYLNNGDVDSFYYSFDIRADGNMISSAIGNTNNSDACTGTWQLSDSTFTATLSLMTTGSPLVQNVAATYDATQGTLTGSWNYTQGSGVNGTFRLYRVE